MNEALSVTRVQPRGRAARPAASTTLARQQQGQLFRKYAVIFVALVSGALLSSGLIELYFSYLENQAALVALQREKAATAAVTIQQFVDETARIVNSSVPQSWAADVLPPEERLTDYRRLAQQSLQIQDVLYVDAAGREVVRFSRLSVNTADPQADHSSEPYLREARDKEPYYSPVYFRGESEPYMLIGIREPGPDGGVTVASVNLKTMWNHISAITVGRAGYAYVVDQSGRLIAHPDISLVLQQTEMARLAHVRAALAPTAAGEPTEQAMIARDLRGRQVLTAHRVVTPPGWIVFVEQPIDEAFQPLIASAVRTAVLLLIGLGLAILASLILARRMVQPIQALQEGAARIGSGALDQRIEVRTGDEVEALAEEFNRMTERLRDSYANLEHKVTERTRDLADALDQLEKANQHKSDLLSTVSHELRTPLGAIKGYATALLRFGPRIRQPERREFLESIDHAADRLSALIEDLLLAQKLEDGLPITPEPFNLPELTEEVVAELAPRAMDHDFVCLLPPDLPVVYGDPRRVRQILVNLLDNAVKYSPAGGEIRITVGARGGDVLVTVRDEGLGIPADHLTRVFERFHRVETGATRTTRGTGLGLYICQGLVQAQGGHIWVESAGPGHGSTFAFTLPFWENP